MSHIILMGVSGSGKTTIGSALAKKLQWPFLDADDFHSAANIEKMRAAIPLTDLDRAQWLSTLHAELFGATSSLILACSALRQQYRDQLCVGVNVQWVWLSASKETLVTRLSARPNHYMPASLLKSQLETLEPPETAINIDVSMSVTGCVDQVIEALQMHSRGH
jgi:carbohydrate kinase (thermoresistant glucokinase family)